MSEYLDKMLQNPADEDIVYQSVEKLCRSTSPYNLHKNHDLIEQIKTRALERFQWGYPPRKHDDTSAGDALNWEWIIQIGSESGADVIIVSSDGDYGHRNMVNDWLAEEFRDKCPSKTVRLFRTFNEALKATGVDVPKKQIIAEKELVTFPPTVRHSSLVVPSTLSSGITVAGSSSTVAGQLYMVEPVLPPEDYEDK